MTLESRKKPPFRAEQVGSLLRPEQLREAQAAFGKGEIAAEQLRSVQDKAIREVVRIQESPGFESVTDGELRRSSWFPDFVCQIENVEVTQPKLAVRFHRKDGDIEFAPPSPMGRLTEGRKTMSDPYGLQEAARRGVVLRDIGHRIVLENEDVRIWELNLEPGETIDFHIHRHPYIVFSLGGGENEIETIFGDRIKIKLERGTYHCGSTPLAIKRFVTIEGAGRNFSTITGNVADFDQGVINGAHDAALRHLTVENRANSSGTAIAIHTRGRRMSLTDIAIKVDSATANNVFGILAPGGSLGLTNVSVQTSASAGQSQGIRGESGAKLNMMNVWVHNQSGAFGNPAALELRDNSSATGYGVLFRSNFFGLLGHDNSVFELVDGTVIGGRGGCGRTTVETRSWGRRTAT